MRHYQVSRNTNSLDSPLLSDDVPAKWMTEQQIEDLFRLGIKFMDITDYTELGSDIKASENLLRWKPCEYDLGIVSDDQRLLDDNPDRRSLIPRDGFGYIPSTPAYEDEVTPFIGNLTTELMESNLKVFTSFRNRYYKSTSGADSAKWLHKQISDTIASADPDSVDVSVRKFKHPWDQFSIIVRFEGTNVDLNNELVIVGAHQDSVNMWMPSFGRAPGADDDGSGTVTILEGMVLAFSLLRQLFIVPHFASIDRII
ncbi:hypothetical protein BC936DRAFT_137002 [Jimgerdemannia flammicorona]|uniref:Peptide hydrolase n=1 Tax=Jimgerdemannia flammicorona TaxID=994334 RepID=A0A433CYA6_9FUNG|nr:hypothetical protein BC936DRAFT_137002 [Jimgerdemannia flammicorona]